MEKKRVAKKVSSLAAWKKASEKTEMFTLPSGITIEVKPLNLLEQVYSGHLPMTMVNEMMKVSEKMGSTSGWEELSEEDLGKLLEVIRRITILAVVEPKIEDTEGIPTNDLFAIFQFVSGGVGGSPFSTFRGE